MSQSRVVFQNQWYVSLLLCSDEYRLLVVVVVVLEEIKQTNKVIVRFLLGKFIILMPPWDIMLNLVQRKLTKNAPSFKYRSSKLYWVEIEYCEYRLKNFDTLSWACSGRWSYEIVERDVQMVGSDLNILRGQNEEKKKIEGRQVFPIRFLFSLSIFLPAFYYLNAWNRLLVDRSNIKKMQPLLNWQRYKGLFYFIVVFVNL